MASTFKPRYNVCGLIYRPNDSLTGHYSIYIDRVKDNGNTDYIFQLYILEDTEVFVNYLYLQKTF